DRDGTERRTPDRALDDAAGSARRLIGGTSRGAPRWILQAAWFAGRTRRRVSRSRSLRDAVWVRVPGRTWRHRLIPGSLAANWNCRPCRQTELAVVAAPFAASRGFCRRPDVAGCLAESAASELRRLRTIDAVRQRRYDRDHACRLRCLRAELKRNPACLRGRRP